MRTIAITAILVGVVTWSIGEAAASRAASPTIDIVVAPGADGGGQYGAERLRAALVRSQYSAKIVPARAGASGEGQILVGTVSDGEAFSSALPRANRAAEAHAVVRRPGAAVVVAGADPAGAMYGCLDLARRIEEAKGLPDVLEIRERPAMSLRGTCILLMKLGLYDYPVTPEEFPFFYDKALWLEYLDFLAENRFNYIAFWNGHPFDYFVKLDKYPEAQEGMPPELIQRNHDMLLWLCEEAGRRNIRLMFQFYQIHTSVYFAKAHNLPPHGISEPSPLLTDYTMYCIERFVSEFPGVGLYVCPGESLQLKRVADWINNVIFAAVKKTGKNPPIMIRSWGIDLPNMKKVAGNYSPLYTERKFNVEHIAGTEVDPENREWSAITGQHVVNVHCLGNLEPFRWSPPTYIQKCLQSSIRDGGASGLHLYPRKCWRWPYGCDKVDGQEVQWQRDWLWFEAWARYAWNPGLDPQSERQHWIRRLAARYGTAEAGEHVLEAYEAQADVLPGIQRLFWLGNDNHTTVVSGMTVEQIETSKGIPFLSVPGMVRMPDYLAALVQGKTAQGTSPVEFLAAKVAEAERALAAAKRAVAAATLNGEDVARIETDAQAVVLLTRFYHHKVQAAAAHTLFMNDRDPAANLGRCIDELEASLGEFRRLSEMTSRTYESISDVPMWYPIPELKKCPFHWTDILPYYEKEFDIARHNATLIRQAPLPVGKRAKESFFKRKLTADDLLDTPPHIGPGSAPGR